MRRDPIFISVLLLTLLVLLRSLTCSASDPREQPAANQQLVLKQDTTTGSVAPRSDLAAINISAGLADLKEILHTSPAMMERTTSALNKLAKNLIVERTRGERDVALFRMAAPGVVLVLNKNGFGSGAVVNRDGHILTNWHVVNNQQTVMVVFKAKDSAELKKELAFAAQVEKLDMVTDLALLKILNPPEGLVSLDLGDARKLSVGQDVHAIGHPEGEMWTYTKGIISQIRPGYKWVGFDGVNHQAKVIQTQTPINPGNSGGPLLDDNGKLIGINSFRAKGQGLNYALAIDAIQEFINSQGSRPASPSPNPEPRCTEGYDTSGKGWNDISGCYTGATSPPPDFWLIYNAPNQPPAYAATDAKRTGQINTVIVKGLRSNTLFWHIDNDCDGLVDVIGSQDPDSGKIVGYKVPQKPVRMQTLAKELDTALKKGKIPYRNLQVCK